MSLGPFKMPEGDEAYFDTMLEAVEHLRLFRIEVIDRNRFWIRNTGDTWFVTELSRDQLAALAIEILTLARGGGQ